MNRSVRIEMIPAVVCAAVLMACAPAFGSSVAPMTVRYMADHAALVISGRVTSVRSYWAENPHRIESEITLDGVTYLKGAPRNVSSTYRLIVPGGKTGTLEMRICCAPQFRAGESWILFILPEYKTFPVVGLYRGAFRTAVDEQGVLRVLSSEGRAVVGLNADGQIRIATGRFDPQAHLLGSVQATVYDREESASDERAISVQDFLRMIQPVLDASRHFPLTHPAGRRVPVRYTPTALSIREAAGGSPAASVLRSPGSRGGRVVVPQVQVSDRPSRNSGGRR